MASKMAKGLFVLMVVVAVVAVAPATSKAVQVCWTLTGFDDTFLLDLSGPSGSATVLHTAVRWRSASSAYELLGNGSVSFALPPSGNIEWGISVAHKTTSFGGNKSCVAYASLNPSTLGGPLVIECPGGSTTPKFTGSATLVFSPTCPSTASPAAASDPGGDHGVGE